MIKDTPDGQTYFDPEAEEKARQDEIQEDTTSMEEKLEALDTQKSDECLVNWEKKFTGEFGIHFSESELLFVLEFIATEKQLSYEEGLNENWGGDRKIQLEQAREEVKKEIAVTKLKSLTPQDKEQ